MYTLRAATVADSEQLVRAVADGLEGYRSFAPFVRSDLWGTGLARTLHDAALDAARERGFSAMRLFCAAEQARARRFYEREGWALAGQPWPEESVGLDMVEYRRRL